MMMKMNVQVLCQDLDQLLKDICDFLTNQIDDDNLTENQRLFANRLVNRSKKQLQQISQVSMVLSTDVDDSSYVDMNKQSAVENEEVAYEEGEDNEYSPIICPEITENSEQVACPYELLPAIELEKCEKFGNLDRKGKFLFIGHQKRLFAGIKEHWLLLYGTKKDSKPLDNVNLSFFIAKPQEGARSKTFELTCTKSLKTFQFVAQTPKDMVQWVACINKRTSIVEEPIKVNSVDHDEDEGENIYEPLKLENEPKDTLRKKSKPLPPLPKPPENAYVLRQPKPEIPSPEMESYDPLVTRTRLNSEESQEDDEIYDDIVNVMAEKEQQVKLIDKPLPATPPSHSKLSELIQRESTFTNSFSEDDEDPIYDRLEQPPPPQFTSRLTKRPADPAPEEEYCNLITKGNAELSEPEEEYCNLVSLQNSRNRNISKPNIVTKPEIEEPEEQYSNVPSNISVKEKQVFVPKSAITKVSPPKLGTFTKQEIEEPEEEYSNLIPNVAILSRKGSQTRPPLKPKPPIYQTRIEDKAIVDEEEEECEYDCIVRPSNSLSNKTSQTSNKAISPNIRAGLSNNHGENANKEPPALKPKPKVPWRR